MKTKKLIGIATGWVFLFSMIGTANATLWNYDITLKAYDAIDYDNGDILELNFSGGAIIDFFESTVDIDGTEGYDIPELYINFPTDTLVWSAFIGLDFSSTDVELYTLNGDWGLHDHGVTDVAVSNITGPYGEYLEITSLNPNFTVEDWGFPNTTNFLGTDYYIWQVEFSNGHSVPEPATMILFGTCLAGFAGIGLRKRNR